MSQPFTVTVNDTPVTASGQETARLDGQLSLTAGTPVTAFVPGEERTAPRRRSIVSSIPGSNKQVTLNLAAQSACPAWPCPTSTAWCPVPRPVAHDRDQGDGVVVGPAALRHHLPYGDPDVISTTGKTATASYSSSEVGPGNWTVTPFLVGPIGKNPAATVNANVSMTATTAASTRPSAPRPGTCGWAAPTPPRRSRRTCRPRPDVTIPVTITPSGAAGTVVSGTLYVAHSSLISPDLNFDDEFGYTPEGGDVAAFPYSYTIG